MRKISSSTMGSGSYGIYDPAGGPVIVVWFCGAWILRGVTVDQSPGYIGNTSSPCVHRTRARARQCLRRAALRNGSPTG